MSYQEELRPYEPPKKSSPWPWILGGCFTVFLLFLVLIAVFVLMVKQAMTGMIAELTETEPMELPPATVTEADYQDVKARMDAFTQAMQTGAPAEPLELTADDLNAYLRFGPGWSAVAENIHIIVEDDVIGADVSIPADIIPIIGALAGEGRYFNGRVTVNAHLENGALRVAMTALEIKGEEIPEDALAEFNKQNIMRDIQQGNPELDRMIRLLDDLYVKEGVLVLVPKESPLIVEDDSPAE